MTTKSYCIESNTHTHTHTLWCKHFHSRWTKVDTWS